MLPILEGLEERRRRAWRSFWRVAAAAGVIASVSIIVAHGTRSLLAGFVGLVVAGLVLAAGAAWCFGGLARDAKASIIGALARFVDPSLTYDPTGYIPRDQFERTRLFTHGVDRYSGEDLVRGKIGATQIAFSEVHAEYKTTSADAKGNRTTSWNTIFKGLFVVADFNKELRGMTLVLPDVAENLLGRMGSRLQQVEGVLRHAERVQLEDPRFEKQFVVYADDQVESRYVLTPALMERLVEFKQKAGRPTYFSFAGPNVSIAIETKRDMFKMGLTHTLIDRQRLQEHLHDLEFAVGIVKDLDLNTRIWTKE